MAKRRKKILLFWSGGKDSAITLFELKSPEWEIVGLATVFVRDPIRGLCAQMHNTPVEVIRAQALSLELPLHEIELPFQPTNIQYEEGILAAMKPLKAEGLEAVAFGDVRLQDVRDFKDAVFKKAGLKTVYPLWEWSPQLVLQAFSGLNHQAIVHCIQKDKLPPAFLGRSYNVSFTDDLPRGVDLAGESGEFHTFVFDGPFFQKKIGIQMGKVYDWQNFTYQEINLNAEQQARHN